MPKHPPRGKNQRRNCRRERTLKQPSCSPQSAPIKGQAGRPKGILKRFPFEQTRLGFMLKYETPAVFDLIIELSPQTRKRNPEPALIYLVCEASKDPTFTKPKFRQYLTEYVRHGLYCKRGKKLTPARARYYERLRHNKLQHYIREHREQIELLRRASVPLGKQ